MIAKIWPFKIVSAGAKVLAQAMDCKRVKTDGAYKPRINHLIINWGNALLPTWWHPGMTVLNNPEKLKVATNKLLALRRMQEGGVTVPPFCTNIEDAQKMFTDGVKRVYCRTKLNGHSGDGIVVAPTPEELVEAPLYTAGVYGFRDEYRIHVVNGEVIDYAMKRKRKEEGLEHNTDVRSHNGGWVYCRDNIACNEVVQQEAKLAIAAVGLDFGAVDIILERKPNSSPVVLEVNTAPGLEGTTIERYANAFKELL